MQQNLFTKHVGLHAVKTIHVMAQRLYSMMVLFITHTFSFSSLSVLIQMLSLFLIIVLRHFHSLLPLLPPHSLHGTIR